MSLVQRMETSPGSDFTGRAVGFFTDVADDVIDRMREHQDGAAKDAIALGIYKLAVSFAVGFFKILDLIVFKG